MLKSILRKKLIKKRKSKVKSSSIISLKRFFSLIKNHNLKKKIIGGYFPVNNEIDDLDLLTELEKKKINI